MSDSPTTRSSAPGPDQQPVLPWWTWFAPFVIFHLGTGLSLQFQVSKGVSLWYLPVPLGIILVHWWGPRVLLGLYFNATLCAGYWGLYRWWLWPLYAIPETLKVALSWWLFASLFKGRPWMPDLRDIWGFLLLGVLVPSLIASAYAQGQLVLLGDIAPADFLRSAYAEFVLDILSPFAIALPALLFGTSLMEREGLSRTRGAFPRPALVVGPRFARLTAEAAGMFAGLLALSFFVSLEKYWFVHGMFLIWAALRGGIGLASLGAMWAIFVAVLLPAMLSSSHVESWITHSDLHRVNLNLATLCFAALVVGRGLSDLHQEIDRRARVEADLRRNEGALRESEGKYRTLFESASDAILLARREGILECNEAALRLFRCGRDGLVGKPASSISPERQPDGTASVDGIRKYREAAFRGAAQRFEWTYRRADGTTFEAEVGLNFLSYDEDPRLLVAIRDISARKGIERALIESEERFRQMAENIQEIFFLLERSSGALLYVSPIAETMLGIPLRDIVADPSRLVRQVHAEDRERLGMDSGTDWLMQQRNEDFRFRRSDGRTAWLRLRSFLIRDADGHPYRVAGVLADITEYKHAQEEVRSNQQRLIQADKMNSLGLMVSGVAHEINNPNNLIMLNADVMETFWKHMRPVLREHHARNPDWKLAGIPFAGAEGKVEALLAGMSGGSRRIKRIVDNLKDFARTDGGDLNESVALDKVVEASVGIVESLIRRSTDRFTVVHGADLPRVRGSFQKLEQVIINLITNACQALDDRRRAIRVSTWHEKERSLVGVRVEDEGRGIPQDLLGKVADPFFTTKRDTGGTGLGLSVSYGIVREHRGHIELTSEENRGTTVEVLIPAQQETA